jgi:hypothetical protein
METHELGAAVAQRLGVKPTDSAVHKVVANVNTFFGRTAEGSDHPLEKTQIFEVHIESELGSDSDLDF